MTDAAFISCDSCGKQVSQEKSIPRDFGHIPISVDMNGLAFCTKACEHEHIGLMIQHPMVPEATKQKLLIENPLLSKQLNIDCNLTGSACPLNGKKKEAATTTSSQTQPIPTSVSETAKEVSEGQDPIEATFLTRIKRKMTGSQKIVIDTESIAKDIAKRALYYSNQPGGIAANKAAIRASGEALKTSAFAQLAVSGFSNSEMAKKQTQIVYEEALADESKSKAFFGLPTLGSKTGKPTWNDKLLAEEFGMVLRRNFDQAITPSGIYHSQLQVDIRRIIHRVIELAGPAGFELLLFYLYDVEGNQMIEQTDQVVTQREKQRSY